jgi:hypothetical protein
MESPQNPMVEMFIQMAQAAKQIKSAFVEQPYVYGTSAPGGVVIPAGQQNVPPLQGGFRNSLGWPFKVRRIRFVNDAQHTFRDWRVRVVDQTFNQEWMKNPILVESLIQVDTGFWELPEPWIMRPMGGAQFWFVDNLDTVNPIQVSIALHGTLLAPGRGE